MSDSPKRWLAVLCVVCYLLLIGSLVFTWVSRVSAGREANPGVMAVRLMYEFESPAELVSNQSKLESILAPEEFHRLRIDDELRAVNTYFKFGYASSRVEVVSWTNGSVVYHLYNENIDRNQLWVFNYTMRDGLIDDVSEYRVEEPAYTEGIFG